MTEGINNRTCCGGESGNGKLVMSVKAVCSGYDTCPDTLIAGFAITEMRVERGAR